MQYGWEDQVNWTLPKLPALFTLPLLALVINFIVRFITFRQNQSKKVVDMIHWLIPIVFLAGNSFILLKPAGLNLKAESFVIPLISVMFIVIGNYLPKTKPNPHIGIRFPWEMNNPEAWAKTNRFGGFGLVIFGFLNLILSFIRIGKYFFVISLLVYTVIITVYSLTVSRKAKQ